MIKPTEEQQAVIDWRGNQLIVNAFAGTGKTSTLVEYAKANPQLKMLYVAFNRAVREEAEAKFPRNVTCKTTFCCRKPPKENSTAPFSAVPCPA